MANCEQLRERYEAYALGALEGQERAELEAHLARACPACTMGVEQARWLVSQLAYMAPDAAPSAGLRRRILEAATGPAATTPHAAPRRAWIPVWAWAAAAALVLFAIYSVNQVHRYESELARLETQMEEARRKSAELESDRQLYQKVLAILSASDTREVNLKAAAQPSLPDVHAFWNGRQGLVLTGQKFPSAAAGRTWQLWVVPKKGNPISAGIFHAGPEGQLMLVKQVEAPMSEAAALAISDEPASGSPQPTTKPLWVGPVS